MNVIARQKFELAYYDGTIRHRDSSPFQKECLALDIVIS